MTKTTGRNPPRSAVRRTVRRALAPVERFLSIEAASGIILIVVSMAALAWANSPWRSFYEVLWHTTFNLRIGSWSLVRDVQFWINDGLMTVFFFVVGLEIRREIHDGVLSDWRRAALPMAMAAGGMALPALIFLALNNDGVGAAAWGVPMATDIAFAAGVLTLLGKRIASPLRVLLLALAVIDDIGAILVIAIFYSTTVSIIGFLVAGAGICAVLSLKRAGVSSPWIYLSPGVVIWTGILASGVHPAIAGVILGLLTPAGAPAGGGEGPLAFLQRQLHGWVAFGIMPLFAFANAGVAFEGVSMHADEIRIFFGVMAGLFLGKPIGVIGASWVATRLGIARFPSETSWRGIIAVGLCAGIGFTMALFIGPLALPAGPLLETAKLAIIGGSAAAAATTLLYGMFALRPTAAARASDGQEVMR